MKKKTTSATKRSFVRLSLFWAKGASASVADYICKRISAIHHLRCSVHPSAIAGFIVAIVGKSFKREPLRHVAHVCMKSLKRVVPTGTHAYPTAAVMMIRRMLGVVAAILHIQPAGIFARHAHAVNSPAGCSSHKSEAPARLRVAIPQLGFLDGLDSTADTQTVPVSVPLAVTGKASNYQEAEGFAGYVFTLTASCGTKGFSHRDAPGKRYVIRSRCEHQLVAASSL